MSEHAAELAMEHGSELEPLAWENLGALPAGVAFRRTLAELLLHPVRFFRRMAVTGGLHEPISFFAILLTLALLLALPAALAYVGLTVPSPDEVAPDVYSAATRPARVAVVVVVLMPLAVVCGSVLMLLTGTLFHVGRRVFGPPGWEGSASVWLYAVGGMLAPAVVWLAVTFAAALAGYLLGLPWPDTREGATEVVRWIVYISGGIAGGLSLAALVAYTIIGARQAFRQDAVMGTASGLAGLAMVILVLGAGLWTFMRRGMLWGLGFAGAVLLVTTVLALAGSMQSRSAWTGQAGGETLGTEEGGE